MTQNKNQLTTTTGTGVALKNVSKSLKITNKLLAEVDTITDADWEWWRLLPDLWKKIFTAHIYNFEYTNFEYDWQGNSENIQRYGLTRLIEKSDLNKILNLQVFKYCPSNKGDKISDISPLSKLKKLQTLDVRNNCITDLSHIKALENLTELNVSKNPVNDLNDFQCLKNLDATYTELDDSSLIRLPITLISLNINFATNKIKNLNFVNNLQSLEKLSINGLHINNYSQLEYLPKLTHLEIESCGLQNLEVLPNLLQLKDLNFWNNPVSSYKPLIKFENLESIMFGHYEFSSPNADELGHLTKLKKIRILEYYDENFNFLEKLINLESIEIWNEHCVNGEQVISKLNSRKLINIDICSDNIDLEDLVKFPNLKKRQIQLRSATHPKLDFTSRGVLNPSTFLGRLFKLSSIAWI